MTELEDIILTIDTREQNQIRIKAVEDYFTGHGAVVEHSALKHCDYRLIGEFRGQSVNLGVEAKGWDNFLSDDIAEMEEKLLLATAEYDHVGFFVETQNYTFIPDENNKHGKLNYSIPRLNKSLPAKTLAAFEGMLDTISKHPQIHVRQLRGEGQFPYSLYDLLVYLQKPHTLTVISKGYIPSLQNLYMQIPQVGVERAKKLIQHYPNLFWLCSASEESLIEVMGKSQGTIVYQFLHNTELLTPEWMAGHHLDGTDKYKTICGQDCYNPQHCNELCERHPNNIKNLKQDDEGRLAFDAPAKNPVKQDFIEIEQVKKYGDGAQTHAKCDFADPKNRAECKTPDHFKQLHSHPGTHPIPPIIPKPDDPQRPPTVVKQESFNTRSNFSSPAEINIGLDDKPLESVVRCRTCYQVITPEQDDESGFCHDPDCLKIREHPSLENKLRIFLREPHTIEEIVEKYGCSTGYTFQVCMANVKSGNIKKITEQDGRVTFQRFA